MAGIAGESTGLVVPGAAGAVLYSDGAGGLTSAGVPTDGQILIGRTSSTPILASITGTANQVIVTGGTGSITLSLPQSVHTGATPQFSSLGLGVAAGAAGTLKMAGKLLTYNNAAPADGQLLIGDTAGAVWSAATLTAGSSITITNGAGAVTIAVTAGSFAPLGASYVTLGTDATLTAERVLTGTVNQITITDNGAGSTVVLSLPQNIHTAATPQFDGLGLGVAGAPRQLLLDPARSVASGVSAVLDTVDLKAATITITGATGITTATGFNLASIKVPTYSAASALTITNAATLYIGGAPAGGGAGPATITNAYALWIDAGAVRIDDHVKFGGTGLPTAGLLRAPNNTLILATRNAADNANLEFLGISSGNEMQIGNTTGGTFFSLGLYAGNQLDIYQSSTHYIRFNGSSWYQRNSNQFAWTDGAPSSATVDAVLVRDVAGRVGVLRSQTVTEYGDLKLRNLLMTDYLEGAEIADPVAPAVNSGRLYFKDNGAAKTQLVVRFNTGAVQVIATEP